MGTIDFSSFFGGNKWFQKPPNPLPPLNLLHLLYDPNASTNRLNFASLSATNSPEKSKEPAEKPGPYTRMAEQFFWECENRPDHRHTPEVERILNEDPLFEKKENPTPEEIEENARWWEEFRSSPIVQFFKGVIEVDDMINEMELKENSVPYHKEDTKRWQEVPHVIGLDGRPIPRKAIKTDEEADDKFWDFARQFFFGLWGFRQRPYPPSRPIDVSQAIGYKQLERRYYDFVMKTGGWFYKDRLGRTRGPMELIQLRTAWAAGIVDKHTFVWGEDLDEWVPICMLYGMERAVATWEARLGAAATAFLYKTLNGIPPWVPLKGHEKKTYKQLQDEAMESKRRDLAVLEANDGVWPGVKTPSHALFFWASGSELTTMLESDHMPNKYIPKYLRRELAKIIPGLRPWEVLSIEQAMDKITYNGKWYREPLGTYTTGPPYIQNWNKDVMRLFSTFSKLNYQVYNKLEKSIPGFSKVMENVHAEQEAKFTDKEAQQKKRAEDSVSGL